MPRPAHPLERTLLLSILGAAAVFTLVKPLVMADLAVFMEMGRWMVTEGRLYEVETYAFTELGTSFVNGTWGAQVLFYALFRLGGYPLLQGVGAACVVGTFALCAHHAYRRGGLQAAIWGAALAFTLALQNLGVRPQIFSLPLFAATWLVADVYAARRWAPWVVGGIFVVWPNLHGAFPVGLVLLAGGLGGAIWRGWRRGGADRTEVYRRGLLLGVAVAATCLNPYGPGIYGYVATNSAMPAERRLDEWLPPDPLSSMGVRLGLSVVLLGWTLWRRRREGEPWGLRLEEALLLPAFLWLAAGSQRMIVWWGLLLSPLLAGLMVPNRRHERADPPPLHTWIWRGSVAFWALMILLSSPTLPRHDEERVTAEGFTGFSRDEPVEAIAALEIRPGGGRVFNRMDWGSYLVWRLWPRYSPFVDPRIWVYSDATWATYLKVSRAEPGWREALDGWGVDVLLVSPEQQGPLVEATRADPRWAVVYEDPRTVLLERVTPAEESRP